MSSSAIDQAPFEAKAAQPTSTDAMDTMALDSEPNGVHENLFHDDHNTKLPGAHGDATPQSEGGSLPAPLVNGNHLSPSPEVKNMPITDVSSGIDPVAPFLPDSQPDVQMHSLFGDSDLGPTSLPNAIEAPTSDVRAEPAVHVANMTPDTTQRTPDTTQDTIHSTQQTTQQVPETQFPETEMDFEHSAPVEPTHVSQEGQDHLPVKADVAPTKPMNDLSLEAQTPHSPHSPHSPSLAAHSQAEHVMDHDMEDAPSSGKVRPREDEDEEDAPHAKRPKTEDETGDEAKFKVPDVPVTSEHSPPARSTPSYSNPQAHQTNGHSLGVAQVVQHQSSQAAQHVQAAAEAEPWPTTPMTQAQTRFLLERVRNTKKIKVSIAFKDPVDPEALGIPTYRNFVTTPMDLSTMEHKLKDGRYTYVRDFMKDLDQMVENSILFNGHSHPVTQNGYNMRAYFLKGMGKMPKGGADDRPSASSSAHRSSQKKSSSSANSKARRERAPSAMAKSPIAPSVAAGNAGSPTAAWPLNADGLPLIRRDSTSISDRPKREIHRPPPKDLPYNNAKPKKKKYAQELRFCESVLAEIMKPKYQAITFPFMAPVDPVALNIPSYLKVIKKPMDFGTIQRNLKAGQYQSAKDFYNDAQLVFQNCYKFNPEGDDVNKMGRQLNELFDSLWREKAEWLAQHAPPSDPQSPGSQYSDDEDDEEEEEVDPAQAQIIAIQKQIQQLNQTAQSLLQQQKSKHSSPVAPSRKKSSKSSAPKRKAPLNVPPPPKSHKSSSKQRSRAVAPLTFAQKQEISSGISTLGDSDMRKAVQIIRNGCPQLANLNDDEMEIDMDEISDDTLRELFKFIKAVNGPSKGVPLDDDFEPPRPTHKAVTSKPKKNKPMGKKEQEESIRRIQEQLQRFEGGSGSSQSPPPNQDESSDDESSGSESEEE